MVLTRRQTQENKHQREIPNGGGSADHEASHQQQQHHAAKTLQHQAQEVAAHMKQELEGKEPPGGRHPTTPAWVYLLLLCFAAVTYVAIPEPFHPPHGQQPTITHVFYYGWLTAISTGLGALPFLLVPDVKSFWVGISNGTCVCSVCGRAGRCWLRRGSSRSFLLF